MDKIKITSVRDEVYNSIYGRMDEWFYKWIDVGPEPKEISPLMWLMPLANIYFSPYDKLLSNTCDSFPYVESANADPGPFHSLLRLKYVVFRNLEYKFAEFEEIEDDNFEEEQLNE